MGNGASESGRRGERGLRRARCSIALATAVAAACSLTGPPPRPWNEPEARPVWPAPPDAARIEFVGSIHDAADLGRAPGFFERLKDLLFGPESGAMVKPVAVARNASGLLVVADPAVPTVHLFDLEDHVYRPLRDAAAEQLRSPVGVAVDDSGRIYVADSVVGRVFAFEDGGTRVEIFGEDVLERPVGLALGPAQDRLYVADAVACQVVVFDRRGRVLGQFGGRGVAPGQFNSPTYVAVGTDGRIAVADSLNFRVQVFRSDGTVLETFGEPGDVSGTFARPKGIAVDPAGHIYVADAAFENVQIFDAQGRLLLALGGPGSEAGRFVLPSGLFLDSDGTLWVADSFNRRLQAFRLLADE